MNPSSSKRPLASKRRSQSGKKPPAPTTRGEKRLNSIVKAATRQFLKYGYANTSVDDIVRVSGGSKATLYKHFRDKRELLGAVVDSVTGQRSLAELDFEEPDIAKALIGFATQRMSIICHPSHIALLRLVIAEYSHHPQIARTYYEHGPGHSYRLLARYFALHARRGRLNVPDPAEAVNHFTGLLLHRWYINCLYGITPPPTTEEIDRAARTSVDAFLRLYRRR